MKPAPESDTDTRSLSPFLVQAIYRRFLTDALR